jgi:hypothetical protein
MTPLGLLNFLVLQWFGVRLAKAWRIEQYDLRLDHVSLMPNGSFAPGMTCKTRRVRDGWRLLRWVVPLTGWWSNFRWIARRS